MRPVLFLTVMCLVWPMCHSEASGRSYSIPLDTEVEGETPSFAVLRADGNSLRLEMRLPSVYHEELTIAGERFQILAIPGGEIQGGPGTPGLPTVSRLVAVPSDVGVTIRVTSRETTRLSGYRLLPVQSEDATEFVIDKAAYGRPMVALPEVSIGEPALLHSLRVVPLTFSPVSFDPTSGEVTVCSRLEVEVSFGGTDTRNAAPLPRQRIPESFHHLYQDLVLNYDDYTSRSDAEVGLGTYLLIYPNATGVLSALQPLIDWRTRQGYAVQVASTAQTGTTTTTIKNYIQDVYNTADPPLEFVTLAGDADGTYAIPCFSYSGGASDHQYTMLEGADNLADVHLGRLSYTSTSSLQSIVTKIIAYETNPPTTDAGWFTRASLTGDPSSSGMTTIQINQWLKTQLLRAGYTQIDTIWSGSFATLMTNSLNQGLTVFGYRGWLGMSNFGTSQINSLTNGIELPFAVFPTCGTGDFNGSTSRSEAFIRNANGGAIGAIGTATTSTHTRYNNCYYAGTWEGAVNGSDHRLGFAHTRGKLNLYLNFQYDGSTALQFSCWNNLMGDPATPMWTAFPAILTASYPATIPVGANSVPVTVTVASVPVRDARVTVYKAGEVLASAYTDFAGKVNLPIDGATAGQVLVTATKYNHTPHLGTITLGSVSTYVGYAGSTIDDDNAGGSVGNGNGIVNPAETIELPVALGNFGTSAAAGVTATIATTDPYVTIIDSEETFGTIGPGATVWSAEDFDFSVSPAAPDGHVVALDLTAQSGASQWTSLIELPVQSAAFEADHFTWGGPGLTADPGESGTLSVRLTNVGSIAGENVTATLSTESPWIDVTDPNGSYGTLNVGSAVENTADPFAISIASDCVRGHEPTFTLTLTFNGSAQATVQFTYLIGSISTTDPTGPDSYGYYAFDNTDVGYPYAPTYNWVEIDPTYGGAGTSVGLSDNGYEQDDTRVLSLPFTFRFYGRNYDQISVCSNGFVAMGETYVKLYMNQVLPGPGAPDAAICPFWDDLYQSGTNKVYYWNDTANHRFVVQWSRMRNYIDSSPSQTQNVEVILFDPAYYPTPTGDGEILFQYHTMSNSDNRNGYATVGIQNHDHTDGLLYTYWNSYPSTAAPLAAGRAIRILTIGSLSWGTLEGTVTNASNGGTALEGVTVSILETNQTALTGPDGHYSTAVSPGTYTVRAEHPSFAAQTVFGVGIVEEQATVLDFSMSDILGPQITNTTVLPNTSDTSGPYTVDATITDFSAISGAHLFYGVNGGSPVDVPMTLVHPTNGLYRGSIPGQPYGSQIDYWVGATDVANNASRDPQGTATYHFSVILLVFYDDMETDQGWTVGDEGDNASSGIWVRVDPNGVWNGGIEVQPEDDATPEPGVRCFITGNDPPGSVQGTDDVDGGATTLLSPWLDLSPYTGVQLSYRRWYTNDTGFNPGQDYWVVQVTDGSAWVDLERTAASDRSWAYRTFPLEDYIPMTSTVRLRFVASDDANGSLVEAGVDEVMILCTQATLTLSGTSVGGQLALQWTPISTSDAYWVHGADNEPYFPPTLANRVAVVSGGVTTWSSSAGMGDPSHNWTYLVRAMNGADQEMARSNRIGEFDQSAVLP